MFITSHPNTDSLTMIRYDTDTGHVSVKTTDPTSTAEPHLEVISLAQFLRAIGIPFKSVRDTVRGDTESAVA